MAKFQLEVGARTVEDAMSAWRGGADRVELYVSPTEGALTPSMGLVQAAVAAKKAANSNLGLFVMLRPRSGDFLYSDADFDTLLRDTENLYAAGANASVCRKDDMFGCFQRINALIPIKQRHGSFIKIGKHRSVGQKTKCYRRKWQHLASDAVIRHRRLQDTVPCIPRRNTFRTL